MADRADYLARTVVARLANLQASLAEDGRGEPSRQQRIAAIEKVLAVELGITDGTTMAAVEAAAPSGPAERGGRERELVTFAEFLRRRLAGNLAEAGG